MEIILENYLIFILIGLFLVFALIGYLVDTARKGNDKNESDDIPTNVREMEFRDIDEKQEEIPEIKDENPDELLNNYDNKN